MLTVLIYQKESQYFIDRYRTLFEQFEESGQIAFCFWDEHGLDVSSALPELTSIVKGIHNWQAVVVLPHKEDYAEEQLLHREENPYDYLINSDAEPLVHESSIPLIRLSQMLGGVPLVNRHYVNVIRKNPDDIPQMVVKRQESQVSLADQQKIWNELNDKYSFPCDRPKFLYFLKARVPIELKIPESSDGEAQIFYESDSSMFWYRNRYSAKTRFLIQDCSRPGNAYYQEDLFRFWMTALTLAINDFPSGTFEAYKVYHTQGNVSLDKILDLFSKYYNRLSAIQFRANLQVSELQKRSELTREQDELPLYKCEIPIMFELERNSNMIISSHDIGFAGDCPIEEEPWWHVQVANTVKAVKKLHSSLRITLDRASSQSRYASKISKDEICDLDEYQFEDMNQQLNDLEKKILTFNTYTALPMDQYYRKLDKEEEQTAGEMKKRMNRKTTLISGLVILLVYLIGFLPDLFYQLSEGESFLQALLITGWGVGILILVSFVFLIWSRSKVADKIHDFNNVIHAVIGNFQSAGSAFSQYLSDCATYMRGRFMLKTLMQRTLRSSEEIVKLNLHVEQLGLQMGTIENWLTDLDMKVTDDKENHNRDYFDFDIPPEKNRGYSIEIDPKPVYIESVGGSECKAPYPFVTGFEVKREALYEKASEDDTTEEMERR